MEKKKKKSNNKKKPKTETADTDSGVEVYFREEDTESSKKAPAVSRPLTCSHSLGFPHLTSSDLHSSPLHDYIYLIIDGAHYITIYT